VIPHTERVCITK